jgi:hypothetical protein
MRITWFREAQQLQQIDLAGRVVQEIGAADDVGDALRGVIHGYREHVRIDLIASPKNEIADGVRHVLSIRPLDAVSEKDLSGLNAQANGCRCGGGELTSAASAGIAQLVL